ncbi:hypothetical protein [Streptomyces purpureus]|uniref:Uncharacterized protein n=1 Tax=Streptomyces purpureus TaxID=1951 RepID=A0A918GWT8_9ACTN|nr:hypothetical protein [Streptomyces purpureus]GGT15446.1 hypothetical protein GCM10014713_05300 [Streptomyces purpureus]
MTGKIVIRVGGLGGYGSDVEPGTFHEYYHVDGLSGSSESLGRGAVEGTQEERQQWQAAGRAFQETLLDASRRLHRIRRRWRRLPGGRRRTERARQEYRERTERATEAYRPVREEIERRLAWHRAEEKRKEAEHQAWRRAYEERQERHRAVGGQEVWGWAVTGEGESAEVIVFRHDVPTDVPPGGRRSEQPLDARELESALLELAREGVTAIVWDEAARDALVAECAAFDPYPSLDIWWSAVTRRYWRSPQEPPEQRPEPRGRSSGASPGTSHHSSHGDGGYGGGDHGGGGYGGGFSFGGY